MKNNKKGFVGIAVAIILALGLLSFGTYKVFHKPAPAPQDQNAPIGNFPSDYKPADHANVSASSNERKENITKLSDESIYHAVDLHGGCTTKHDSSFRFIKIKQGYSCNNTVEGFGQTIGNFSYGDLNGDGYEDAIAEFTTCGGSCGFGLGVFINQADGTSKMLDAIQPNVLVGSSAAQTEIKSIIIKDGVIFITAQGFRDSANWDNIVTKKFKYDGSEIFEIK
ncbi:MAG: hypothetical protein V4438_03115 [Patescibacteria group bacterium]